MKNMQGDSEPKLTECFIKKTGWTASSKNFKGLFGWKCFKSDGQISISGVSCILEVKKVMKNKEYGFWHGAIQSLIYSHLLSMSDNTKDIPILCIILDWGRNSGKDLSDVEKNFLNRFRDNKIFFVRLNYENKFFIEHNITSEYWEKL